MAVFPSNVSRYLAVFHNAFAMNAAQGADCLAVVTEWGDYRRPDFDALATTMAAKVIFEGRNLYDPAEMQARGFTYHAIGKQPVVAGREA